MTKHLSTKKFDNVWIKGSVCLAAETINFQDITQNMFYNLTKISRPIQLGACFELCWWHLNRLLSNKLLKITPLGTYHIIMEFPRIFNVNLNLIMAKCCLRNHWLHCIQTWYGKLLHTTDYYFCNYNFSWHEFFNICPSLIIVFG